MYIFIFVLKLFEYLLYRELASGYPSIVTVIDYQYCIFASANSLLISIIIYFYIKKRNKNKMGDKRKIMIISIILLIFTIALIYLVVITFSYMFPTDLRICRSVGLLLSIITCTFVIYKFKILKH